MDPTIKSKWLEALRSGKYEQARQRLRFGENNYCCLGVLCEIVDPSGWYDRDDEGDFIHRHEEGLPGSDVYQTTLLSEEAAEELSSMNDEGQSFAQIADYIEKTL